MTLVLQTVEALLDKYSDRIQTRIGELKKENPEITTREITDALDDEFANEEYYNSVNGLDALIEGFQNDDLAIEQLLRELPLSLLQGIFNNVLWFNFGGDNVLYAELHDFVERAGGGHDHK